MKSFPRQKALCPFNVPLQTDVYGIKYGSLRLHIGSIKPDRLLKHWNHGRIHVPQFSPTTGSLTSLPSTSKLVDIQVSRRRLSCTGAYWGNPTPQADIVRYISQPVDAPKVSVEPRPLIEIVSQAKGTLPIQRSSSNGCVRDQMLQLTTTSIGGIKPDGLLKHWNHEHIHVPQFSPTTGSLTSLPLTSKLVDIQVSRRRLSCTGAYWGNPTPQADIVRYISQPVDAPKVSVEPRPLFEIVSQAKGTLPIQRSSSNGCVRDQIRQLTTTYW